VSHAPFVYRDSVDIPPTLQFLGTQLMANITTDLIASRELLYNLTLREVRGKYKRTILGQLWSLANPIATMVIFTFVFSFVFRVNPGVGNPSGLDSYALWLMCGLLPWIFFSGVITAGAGSLLSNAGLIQKVYFPRAVLPISLVIANGYNWMFGMGVLVVVILLAGAFVLPWLPLVLIAMVVLAIFSTGVALVLAIANVYFRDTQYLLTLVIQVWFYLTPVIYPVSLVEKQSAAMGPLLGTPITFIDIYGLNPMDHFISVFRSLLYDNTWPAAGDAIACCVWAAVSLAIGLAIFTKSEKGLAEAL
jgi:lipopolysaccharide transport system permease protein